MADNAPSPHKGLPVARIVRRKATPHQPAAHPPHVETTEPHETFASPSYTAGALLSPPVSNQLAPVKSALSAVAAKGAATTAFWFAAASFAIGGPIALTGPGGIAACVITVPILQSFYRKSAHAQLRRWYAASDAHVAAALQASPIVQYQQLLKIRDVLFADHTIGPKALERWRKNYVLNLAYQVLHISVAKSNGSLPPIESVVENFYKTIQAMARQQDMSYLQRDDLKRIFYGLLQFYQSLPQGRRLPMLTVGELAMTVGAALPQEPIHAPGSKSPDRDLGLYLDLIFNFVAAYESQESLWDAANLRNASQHLQAMQSLPSLAASLMQLNNLGTVSLMWGSIGEPLHFTHGQMAHWIHSHDAKAFK